jgi:hypothetical protein
MLKRVMTVLLPSPMLIRLVVTTALAGGGCASQISPTPPMLGRIAVLPPSDATHRPLSEVRGGTDGSDAPSQSLPTSQLPVCSNDSFGHSAWLQIANRSGVVRPRNGMESKSTDCPTGLASAAARIP